MYRDVFAGNDGALSGAVCACAIQPHCKPIVWLVLPPADIAFTAVCKFVQL